MGNKQINRLIKKIKERSLLRSLNLRLRLAGRIRNANVFSEYINQKDFYALSKRFKNTINSFRHDTEAIPQKSDYIFTSWLQGEDNAPEIVKACINSWRRLPNKKVVVIDKNKINQYITLPDHINEKWEKGLISNAHYSDILRTGILLKYGGCWVDATVFLSSRTFPKYIEKSCFFMFQNVSLSRKDKQYCIPSNWFIYSETNNPVLQLTYDLLIEYWKHYNYAFNYFVYHLFFTIAAQKFESYWNKVPVYSNQPPHILQFELSNEFSVERWNEIVRMSDIHKLNWRHQDSKNGLLTFHRYIVESDRKTSAT